MLLSPESILVYAYILMYYFKNYGLGDDSSGNEGFMDWEMIVLGMRDLRRRFSGRWQHNAKCPQGRLAEGGRGD